MLGLNRLIKFQPVDCVLWGRIGSPCVPALFYVIRLQVVVESGDNDAICSIVSGIQ